METTVQHWGRPLPVQHTARAFPHTTILTLPYKPAMNLLTLLTFKLPAIPLPKLNPRILPIVQANIRIRPQRRRSHISRAHQIRPRYRPIARHIRLSTTKQVRFLPEHASVRARSARPLGAAYVAQLGSAAAGHVVAAGVALYVGAALVAALPALGLGVGDHGGFVGLVAGTGVGAFFAACAGRGEAGCACTAEFDDFVGHDEAGAAVGANALVRIPVEQRLGGLFQMSMIELVAENTVLEQV